MRKLSVFAVILIIAFACITLYACDKPSAPLGPQDFLHTDGIRIVDCNGDYIGLQGTNLGGWLVQEEWLCPTEVDGEFAQIDLLLALYNRFGRDEAERLIDVYEENWLTEQDFATIKNIGLNCVRIPFGYFNLMNALTYDQENEVWVRTEWDKLQVIDNWQRLDWALEMCKKYELYAILDLHGAVGSQSGNDHTGDISAEVGRLWRDDQIGEICRQKTMELWVAVANRYCNNTWVGAYDLINEPGVASINPNGGKDQITDKRTWDYFDELINAIRIVDNNHMISVESCWLASNLPDPHDYGWQNVLYQYHHYNWASNGIDNAAYYQLNAIEIDQLVGRDYPVLIGEFNVWADSQRSKHSNQTERQAWAGVIELYTGKGWSYTTWNFKHAATHSSWGLFNLNTNRPQADFFKDSAQEIEDAWKAHNSTNYHENTDLTECISPYVSTFYTGEETKPYDEEYYILDNVTEE